MMKKTCTYIVVCTLLILMGVILTRLLPPEQKESSSILSDQAESLAFLLPERFDLPVGVLGETVEPFAIEVLTAPAVVQSVELPQSVAKPTEALPASEPAKIPSSVIPQSFVTLVAEGPVPAAPASPVSAAPVSYIYFYTGIPVQRDPMPVAPMKTVFYTGGFTSVTVAATPVARIQVVPIFTPQVASSRMGAPKLVYSNGVVIKPKVYFPKQPVRNTLRSATP